MSEEQPSLSTRSTQANYANHLNVGHNAFEFVFDFGQQYDAEGDFLISARIVTTPYYAEAFFETLQRALEDYRQRFGPVAEGDPAERH